MTGTIATISPSFMTIGEAQAQPYYNDRMDNDYNSYGPTDYGTDKKYNSYEPLYGMDSYDKPIPIYDDKKLYDDKPIYPSYVKDDRDNLLKIVKKA